MQALRTFSSLVKGRVTGTLLPFPRPCIMAGSILSPGARCSGRRQATRSHGQLARVTYSHSRYTTGALPGWPPAGPPRPIHHQIVGGGLQEPVPSAQPHTPRPLPKTMARMKCAVGEGVVGVRAGDGPVEFSAAQVTLMWPPSWLRGAIVWRGRVTPRFLGRNRKQCQSN